MDCTLTPTGKTNGDQREYLCAGCGRPWWSEWPAHRLHRECGGLRVAMAVVVPASRSPCVHLGEERRRELCPSCRGRVQVKVFACAVHGECTLEKPLPGVSCCRSCEDFYDINSKNLFQSSPEVTKLNLIYHITPLASNNIWRENVKQLLHRIHIFNGKRVIGIAKQSPKDDVNFKLSSVKEVMKAFRGYDCEFIVNEHSKKLLEAINIIPLLEAVESEASNSATFYAHAKGVSRYGTEVEKAVEYHRNMMYHELLDRPTEICQLLTEYSMVGTTRINHPDGCRHWSSILRFSKWHYSGTYYWLRDRDFFSIPNWRNMLRMRIHGWLTEALPGIAFDYDKCYCVAYDNPSNVYNETTFNPQIKDTDKLPDIKSIV